MARTISHSFAALTREILFLPLEQKIHIFSPPCNILYNFFKIGKPLLKLGSISAGLSCLVYVPPREELQGRRAGSLPEQWLVIEPMLELATICKTILVCISRICCNFCNGLKFNAILFFPLIFEGESKIEWKIVKLWELKVRCT